jgi:hypothetical protein
LDDGTGRDPLDVHDFGSSAQYLFRPCKMEDGSYDETCDISFMSNATKDYISDADSEIIARIRGPAATKTA